MCMYLCVYIYMQSCRIYVINNMKQTSAISPGSVVKGLHGLLGKEQRPKAAGCG